MGITTSNNYLLYNNKMIPNNNKRKNDAENSSRETYPLWLMEPDGRLSKITS